MGCVDSSKFFCAFLETLVDVENALVDTEIFVLTYGNIAKTPTPPSPLPHLQELHLYCLLHG